MNPLDLDSPQIEKEEGGEDQKSSPLLQLLLKSPSQQASGEASPVKGSTSTVTKNLSEAHKDVFDNSDANSSVHIKEESQENDDMDDVIDRKVDEALIKKDEGEEVEVEMIFVSCVDQKVDNNFLQVDVERENSRDELGSHKTHVDGTDGDSVKDEDTQSVSSRRSSRTNQTQRTTRGSSSRVSESATGGAGEIRVDQGLVFGFSIVIILRCRLIRRDQGQVVASTIARGEKEGE